MSAGRVLVVDDDRAMCEMLATGLSRRGFAVAFRTGGAEAIALLRAEDFDVIVTDLNMRDVGGLDLCAHVQANRPDLPVLVLTAFGSLDTAVGAIRAGAYDFLTKPVELDALALAIERAARHRELQEEVRRLRRAVADASRFEELLGKSEALRKTYDIIDRVAPTDATVLVTGESGTGKELAARAIHKRSRRAAGPFVALNCSALPEALLESELFGHARGAFTDAREARQGLLLHATGGTLFLDEIGDLPPGVQPKLLRALQERRVRPVGGNAEVAFDVRIIAATNRDLEADVREKRFREDLYFRVNVVHVELPPLRARGSSDVLLLAQHFMERFAAQHGKPVRGIAEKAAELLIRYHWPGNVRELSNVIERAVALARFDRIGPDDLPDKIREARRSLGTSLIVSDDPAELVPIDEIERRYILHVVEALGGNKSLAAQVLGLDRRTLYRKLEKYGVAMGD